MSVKQGVVAGISFEILENPDYLPVAVDELIRQCQCSPSLVLIIVVELKLAAGLERQAA